MRKLALFAVVAIVGLGVAPTLANGPSGSHEEDGATWDNQVTCGSGTATPAGVVYAGANGVEVCNGGGVVPLQGRVIVTSDQGGYVAADGDASNSQAEQAQGWVRVDGNGVRCGDAAGKKDATHPGAEDTSADCG